MTTDYLNNIVYHRKATTFVLPEHEANKNDPNLVPMTVAEAIQFGYINKPGSVDAPDNLQVQNESLSQQLIMTQDQLEKSEQLISQLREKNEELESQISNSLVPQEALNVTDATQVEDKGSNVLPASEAVQQTESTPDGQHDDISQQLAELNM